MNQRLKMGVGLAALALAFYGTYALGRRAAPFSGKGGVTWWSEYTQAISGQKAYLVNIPVKCPNGKDLGVFQLDLNLRNGKWRIVRNDAGLEPSCGK
jgi:hypothetical protein